MTTTRKAPSPSSNEQARSKVSATKRDRSRSGTSSKSSWPVARRKSTHTGTVDRQEPGSRLLWRRLRTSGVASHLWTLTKKEDTSRYSRKRCKRCVSRYSMHPSANLFQSLSFRQIGPAKPALAPDLRSTVALISTTIQDYPQASKTKYASKISSTQTGQRGRAKTRKETYH